MRTKPPKINYKNSVTGNMFCKPVTGWKPVNRLTGFPINTPS